MTTFRNRQPEGIPTGGQFATMTKSESDVSIASGGTSLSIDEGCNTEAVRALADAGLKGRFQPYRGDDPDVAEGSVTYNSPEGHEMVISGLGSAEVQIRTGNPDDNSGLTMSHGNNPSAEEIKKGIDVAAWMEDTNEAFGVSFTDGENEIRETYFDRNIETGDMVAGMTVSDSEGNWHTVDHNFTTGQTTATPESGPGSHPLPEADLDAIMSDLTGTDASGNSQAVAAAAFGKIRNRVQDSPFYNTLANAQIPQQ